MDKEKGLPEFGLLRIKHVLRHYPVSKSHWYQGVKSGIYPKPVKQRGITGWRICDIKRLCDHPENEKK